MSDEAARTADHVTFDFRSLNARDRYKLMIGSIVPRPIALVTTVDEQGRYNAAPFSFFNCLSADPPILALGVETYPDWRFKDTGHNIRMTDVFTVNIVSHAITAAMEVCAERLEPGVDEIAAAGLTAIPGTTVACPRIKEAPIAFECRRHVSLELSKSRQIVLGEILLAHYHADVVDPERLYIDSTRLDAVGRMGGNTYATTRDRFAVTPAPYGETGT